MDRAELEKLFARAEELKKRVADDQAALRLAAKKSVKNPATSAIGAIVGFGMALEFWCYLQGIPAGWPVWVFFGFCVLGCLLNMRDVLRAMLEEK